MNKPTKLTVPTRVDPYTVPEEQTGWRRLQVPGNYKRKVFTLFWTDQFMIQASLSWGEKGVRHIHESGELNVSFTDALHPQVWYHPPDEWHGGEAGQGVLSSQQALLDAIPSADPTLVAFLKQFSDEQQALRRQVAEIARQPGPHMTLDILFPPFKTTIDDPNYPGSPKTIIGPWED